MLSLSPIPGSGRTRVWLSTAETCDVLGISRETLRRLRLRGSLPTRETRPPLGLHAELGAPAMAYRECRGSHYGLEQEESAGLTLVAPS